MKFDRQRLKCPQKLSKFCFLLNSLSFKLTVSGCGCQRFFHIQSKFTKVVKEVSFCDQKMALMSSKPQQTTCPHDVLRTRKVVSSTWQVGNGFHSKRSAWLPINGHTEEWNERELRDTAPADIKGLATQRKGGKRRSKRKRLPQKASVCLKTTRLPQKWPVCHKTGEFSLVFPDFPLSANCWLA